MPITAQDYCFLGVQEGHTLHLVERVPRPPPEASGQPAEHPGQSEHAWVYCCIPITMCCLPGLCAGSFPIAMGSLELDSDETDVNAVSILLLPYHAELERLKAAQLSCVTCLLQLMANIFQQLGGQGQIGAFLPGDGGSDGGEGLVWSRTHRAYVSARSVLSALLHSQGMVVSTGALRKLSLSLSRYSMRQRICMCSCGFQALPPS